jgi:hypothetical protein
LIVEDDIIEKWYHCLHDWLRLKFALRSRSGILHVIHQWSLVNGCTLERYRAADDSLVSLAIYWLCFTFVCILYLQYVTVVKSKRKKRTSLASRPCRKKPCKPTSESDTLKMKNNNKKNCTFAKFSPVYHFISCILCNFLMHI